jgi:hypothetical protein
MVLSPPSDSFVVSPEKMARDRTSTARILLLTGLLSCSTCTQGSRGGGGTVHATVVALTATTQITRIALTISPAGVSQDLTYDAASGVFTGTFDHLPAVLQTVQAQAYAGPTLIGSATAQVTVTSGQVAQVSLTILDTSGATGVPDHAPVITSFVVGQSSARVGDRLSLSATAVDVDGDAIVFAWTVTPSGCGTLSSPDQPATTWTGASAGTCTVTLTVTARGQSDARQADVQVTAAAAYAFPLRASANGHYLVDQNGTPFRIHGDAGWSLVANLTQAGGRSGSGEVATYLDDRKARGFNTVIVNVIEHKFAASAPANRAGAYPFTRHTAGSYDFSTPNESYFAFADLVIDMAADRGMLVLLWPMYLGFNGGDEGWWGELTNAINTQAVCLGYGQYVGARWLNRSNIIWVEGGDYGPPAGSEGEARAHKIMEGIQAAGASQLQTGHWVRTQNATSEAAFATAMQLEAAYVKPISAGGSPYTQLRSAYGALPVFVIEDGYENEGSATPASLRHAAWGDVLSGIGGYVFGNDPIWHFGAPAAASFRVSSSPPYDSWQHALAATGSLDMQRMAGLLDGLAWYDLVPSGLGTIGTLVTAGGGSVTGSDYVAAAATPGGTLLVAYVPTAHSGPVTVDMTRMAGSTRARWYDPTDGSSWLIGTYPNTGAQGFTIRGANAAGAADWVLVLEAPR